MIRVFKLLAVLCVALAAASGALAALQQRRRLPVPDESMDPLVRIEQLKRHRQFGLQAAADLTGEFTTRVQYPNIGGPSDVDELVAISDLVVVGVPHANTSRLIQSSGSIATFYDIDVKVARGVDKNNNRLTLVLRGGRTSFPSGSWAQENLVDFWPMKAGAEYVFFLQQAQVGLSAGNSEFIRGRGAYEPTAGPLGVYDLSQERGPFVLPAGNHQSVLGRRILSSKMSPQVFVDRVFGPTK